MSDKKKKEQIDEEKLKKNQWIELSEVIKFLESKGMEIKDCAYNQNRTDFIKGKILDEYLRNNLEQVCEKVNKAMKTEISPKSPEKAIQQIYDQFKSVGIISKACREEGDKKKNVKVLLPYEQLVFTYGCNCGTDHDREDVDHPKKLDIDELNRFDPSFFYVLNIHRSKSLIYFFLFLIIFIILMYALMPVWPYCVKVGVWWVSFVLLLIIIGIYAIRLIVYGFFFIFGYDIWLLPDIDDNKLGFFESFYRVISVEKRNEKWYTIVIRIVLAIASGYVGFCIYKNPKLVDDAQKLVMDALRDIYSFGEDKFVNSWNNTAIQLKNKKRTRSIQELDDLI